MCAYVSLELRHMEYPTNIAPVALQRGDVARLACSLIAELAGQEVKRPPATRPPSILEPKHTRTHLQTIKALRKGIMATIKAVRDTSEASRMESSFSNRTIHISRRGLERRSIALPLDPRLERVTESSDDEKNSMDNVSFFF